MEIKNVDDFYNFVEKIESNSSYKKPLAFGIGIATVDSEKNILETFFPFPNYKSNFGCAAVLSDFLNHNGSTNSYILSIDKLKQLLTFFSPFEADGQKHENIESIKIALEVIEKNSNKIAVASFISNESDLAVKHVSDAYLRLHLLSHRMVKPNEIALNGIFNVLPNVVWTSLGAVSVKDFNQFKINAMISGQNLVVHSVDKFPRMVDYVVPTGVRIADASRIRLGAYLGEGSTVMHEGFINFNAGTEGPNMVEGRISAGVFVEKGSDLGGGCSTMGTLSGGGNVVISVGKDCLIGANAGIGISLGNKCTVEAGLYVTSGTKVLFEGKIIKALELSGSDNILFRRNSQTGQVEAINKENKVQLNTLLHA